jgi:hypothetical protein
MLPGHTFERMALTQARRVSRVIVGIAVFVALCIGGFIVWSTWLEGKVAQKNGRTQGYNLAIAVANELSLSCR